MKNDKKCENHPVSMKLAAKTTSLDKIKIVPVDYNTGIRQSKKTYKLTYMPRKKLTEEVLQKLNGLDIKGNRSDFIEKILTEYLKDK